MAKIISILNFKGGVGKSTTAVNVAKALHMDGNRVLVIDADPQGNASRMMGEKPTGIMNYKKESKNRFTLYEAMMGKRLIEECLCVDQEDDNSFHFIQADSLLSDLEEDLIKQIARERVMSGILERVSPNYDYILIDCPPNDGLIAQNAMSASDYILVPVNGEIFAIDGLSKILNRYDEIRRKINPKLRVLGFVFTLTQKNSLHRDIKEYLKQIHSNEGWPGFVFDTEIKRSIILAKAAAASTNIFDYSPYEPSAFAYRRLAKEIMEKIELCKE